MGYVIQSSVLDSQTALEDNMCRMLKARGKPAVLITDRGTCDGRVYISEREWERYMQDRDTNIVELRDSRYDAVFHLVTAADGAEHAYSLENNAVRTETPEMAVEVDRKTQRAWTGHPHLYVIDNSTDFEGKMERLMDVIAKIVGLPSNLQRRSAKFLLASPPDLDNFPPDLDYHLFVVEKIYLRTTSGTSEDYSFLRRRTSLHHDGSTLGTVYQLTTVTFASGEMVERKRIISRREYLAQSENRDAARHVVHQKRVSFLYKLQSFTIHMYREPVDKLCILHAQVEASQDGGEPEVVLPPFLDVERRLLHSKEDEQQYGSYSLSLKNRIDSS